MWRGIQRRLHSVNPTLSSGDDSASDGFRVLDLAWLGRLLGRRALPGRRWECVAQCEASTRHFRTGAKKLLLLLFDPLQALTFLCGSAYDGLQYRLKRSA